MTTPTTQSTGLLAKTLSSTSPLDQNPDKGGTPAMASQPTMKVPKVHGSYLRRPPMRLRSCSSSSPWMTEPAPKKSSAL